MNLSKERRAALVKLDAQLQAAPLQLSPQITAKFTVAYELSELVVPKDYVHSSCLQRFLQQLRDQDTLSAGGVDRHLFIDGNFPNPSKVLAPDLRYHVRAMMNRDPKVNTTYEERMAFLISKGAVLVGAQGLAVVCTQFGDRIKPNMYLTSYDHRNCLYTDQHGDLRTPTVGKILGNQFEVGLGRCDLPFPCNNYFLLITEVPTSATPAT